MEKCLKFGVLFSLCLLLRHESIASPDITILAHEEDFLKPPVTEERLTPEREENPYREEKKSILKEATETFSLQNPLESELQSQVENNEENRHSPAEGISVSVSEVPEENTNPPFPSQSSSFWQREDEEGGRDYETPPTDTVVETKAEDESKNRKRGSAYRGSQGEDERPNIILIITDDQDIELGSMEYMPETLKIFRDEGVEFRHGYVSTPICCPSRSSLLTGLYVHNHEVFTNNDNCSSINWREKFEKKTFASYLWSSGYYTSYIGKYLNKYDGSPIPHGWDEWNGLLMNSRYYNYTLNRNGKRFRYGNDLEHDYYPDSIARDALDFIERISKDRSRQPFLLVLSFPSPHGPEDSAPKYSNLFLNATPHHTPSYNFAPNSDKQWILRVTDKMTPVLKEFTNLLMTKRLQTLQSVDIAVRDIFRKLEESRLRDSTYAFYTSDHGYHVGQFGLVKGKSMPYEFDIRVPFFLAGPKDIVEGGTIIREPVLNIDFAPTFLELASLPIPESMDGRSMVPLIKKYCPTCPKEENFEWPDVFLIESPGRRSPPSGSSSGGGLASSSGEVFDKHHNHNHNLKKVRRKHREKLIVDDDEVLSLTHLCAMHPHPCMPGQKKYCRKEKNRIRFRKCRQNIDFLVSTRLISQSHDPRINDPLYGHNVSSLPDVSNQKCSCRFKRSATTSQLEHILEDEDDLLDWETERKRIDDEIEKLKQRIEYLRQRRKEIRRKWLAENIPPGGRIPPSKGRIAITEPSEKSKHFNRNKSKNNEANNNNKNSTETLEEDKEVDEYDLSNESEEKDDLDENDKEEDDEDSLEEENNNRNPSRHEDDVDTDEFREGRMKFESETDRAASKSTTTAGQDRESSTEAVNKIDVTPTTSTSISTVEGSVSEKYDNEQEFPSSSTTSSPGTTSSSSSTRKPGFHHGHGNGKNKHHKGKNKFKGIYAFNKNSSPSSSSVINEDGSCNCYNDPKWLRQKEREDRKHRKILSKLRKKQRLFKRIEDPVERQQAETCGKEEKMNCFWHDSDHWRTPPFWESGSFCFCMNANNNSYSCLRSVNSTHNYLYCQFVTGFKMYFDLIQDPYQLKNTIDTLPASSEDWIMARLYKLKQCKGRDDCWSDDAISEDAIHPSLWEQIFGRWPKKRRRGNNNGRRRKYQDT